MKIINIKLVILLEYQPIKASFSKGYVPNWTQEYFVIKKVKNTVPQTDVISDIKREEIFGMFYEKELQETNHKEFRDEKVTTRKDDKLCIKWKGHNNSFNSWIDKKRHSINE